MIVCVGWQLYQKTKLMELVEIENKMGKMEKGKKLEIVLGR